MMLIRNLPTPFRELAYYNSHEPPNKVDKLLIDQAFSWVSSEEGIEFWRRCNRDTNDKGFPLLPDHMSPSWKEAARVGAIIYPTYHRRGDCPWEGNCILYNRIVQGWYEWKLRRLENKELYEREDHPMAYCEITNVKHLL